MPSTPFKPSWAKHEAAMHGDDAKESIKATNAFVEEREKEMKQSKQARDWEKSRKESFLKDKPAYLKKIQKEEKENDPVEIFKRQMKSAGVFEWGLTPTEGFVVVEVRQMPNMTKAGIYLPEGSEEGLENTGVVIGYGPGALHYSGQHVECPAEVGDMILFKKGAGLDITLRGKVSRFMRFDDILGVFDKG